MNKTIPAAIILVIIMVVASIGMMVVSNNKDSDDNGTMKVYYFGVGGGLSMLVQTPDGKNILIDAGTFQPTETNNVSLLLKGLNISKIDVFIITHPHPDHTSYAAYILRTMPVGALYYPNLRDIWSDVIDPEIYNDFINATEEIACPVYTNDDLQIGNFINVSSEMSIQIVGLNQSATAMNNGCLVTRMVYKDVSFLFTGDASRSEEQEMLNNGLTLRSDVLQVGHHGINDSTSKEFVDAVQPDYAIISCGMGLGDPQEPQPGVLINLEGIPIYLTMFSTWILAETDGHSIDVNSLRGGD